MEATIWVDRHKLSICTTSTWLQNYDLKEPALSKCISFVQRALAEIKIKTKLRVSLGIVLKCPVDCNAEFKKMTYCVLVVHSFCPPPHPPPCLPPPLRHTDLQKISKPIYTTAAGMRQVHADTWRCCVHLSYGGSKRIVCHGSSWQIQHEINGRSVYNKIFALKICFQGYFDLQVHSLDKTGFENVSSF